MAGLGEKNGAAGGRNKRSNLWKCGTCGVTWTECKCRLTEATESINSILKSCKGLSDKADKEHLLHLNVFVYFSYRRWASPHTAKQFSAAVFPPFEGWHAAWIQPKGNKAKKIKPIEHSMLQVLLRFQDGTSMEGFISRGGELILQNPAASPRLGVFLDPDVAKFEYEVMPVSKMLTMNEIITGIRGNVIGSVMGQNNGRRMSHIVSDDGEGGYRMMKYPRDDYDEASIMTLPHKRVKAVVPQCVEEFKFRHRRRFTKEVARSIHPFLESFFERARASDLEQRAARFPVVDRPSADVLLKNVMKNLEVLNRVMQENRRKDGGGGSAGNLS